MSCGSPTHHAASVRSSRHSMTAPQGYHSSFPRPGNSSRLNSEVLVTTVGSVSTAFSFGVGGGRPAPLRTIGVGSWQTLTQLGCHANAARFLVVNLGHGVPAVVFPGIGLSLERRSYPVYMNIVHFLR